MLLKFTTFCALLYDHILAAVLFLLTKVRTGRDKYVDIFTLTGDRRPLPAGFAVPGHVYLHFRTFIILQVDRWL